MTPRIISTNDDDAYIDIHFPTSHVVHRYQFQDPGLMTEILSAYRRNVGRLVAQLRKLIDKGVVASKDVTLLYRR